MDHPWGFMRDFHGVKDGQATRRHVSGGEWDASR
jgi:hypothetical protein